LVSGGDGDLIRRTLARLGTAMVRPGPLFELIQAPAKDAAAVVAALRRSPALCSRVLSVINSAAYGMSRQIASIERAVLLLGASRARAVALAYGLRLMNERCGLSTRVQDRLWTNALQKACAARRFCQYIDPEHADNAYCLGLVQDIGLPMLMGVDPEYYETHITGFTANVPWCSHEVERFGLDHATVAHGLLTEWRASKELQVLVLNHHRTPPRLADADSQLLELAVFFAGLFPHLDESLHPDQAEWLQAIHARFLAQHVATPDLLLEKINDDVSRIRGSGPVGDSPPVEQLVKRLISEVSASTVTITAKLCRLEHRLNHERQGLVDLKFQAFTDPLTKVLNRRGFTQLGERRLEVARENNQGVCCMLSDMDEFKAINDTYGHEVGDLTLRGLSKMMRRQLAPSDLISRLGGDEFAILFTCSSLDEALDRARRVVDSIEGKKLRLKPGLEVTVHLSMGAVYRDHHYEEATLDDLMTMADKAMYERKRNGKHGLVFTTMPPAQAENPRSLTRNKPR
jgi:diguanylate cyclase (GGDEF)-like protein